MTAVPVYSLKVQSIPIQANNEASIGISINSVSIVISDEGPLFPAISNSLDNKVYSARSPDLCLIVNWYLQVESLQASNSIWEFEICLLRTSLNVPSEFNYLMLASKQFSKS